MYSTPDAPIHRHLGLLLGASCAVTGTHALLATYRLPMPSTYPGTGQINGSPVTQYLATAAHPPTHSAFPGVCSYWPRSPLTPMVGYPYGAPTHMEVQAMLAKRAQLDHTLATLASNLLL